MAEKKVFIVEDHPIMLDGISRLVEMEAGLSVLGSASTYSDALEKIELLVPDMGIIDLSLPDGNGLELIKDLKLRDIDIPILVISMHHEDYFASRALQAGAKGFLMKSAPPEKFREALREVSNNRIYVSDEVKNQLLGQMVSAKPPEAGSDLVTHFSDRELEVFRFLGEGYKPSEIAAKMNLSVKTVDTYRERMKNKLNLESSAELTRQAIRWVGTSL